MMNSAGDSDAPQSQSHEADRAIVVVVPIFRDASLTLECIAAAMPSILTMPRATLVAIDDASPEQEMGAALLTAQSRWKERFVVLRNEINLGFVKTANLGIRFDPGADVVLLNNDVIVPPHWLETLAQDAQGRPDAGSVTAMSNNTTISAFPNFMRDNDPPLGLGVEAVEQGFAVAMLPLQESPTGIGFCMYIKRACIDQVGELDEESFGKGYGEENDFCLRARAKGWNSYLTANLYVHHRGGVSFGASKVERVRHAEMVLDKRYPGYHLEVLTYVARDPMKMARWMRYLDLLRVAGRPVVVHISHGLGGGVEQHIIDLSRTLQFQLTSLILRPEDGGRCVSIGAWDADESMKLTLNAVDGFDTMIAFLKAIGVSMVHFHHVLNLPPAFHGLGALLGARQIFTAHDFYLVNGNPTLTNAAGIFDEQAFDTADNPLYPLPKGLSPAQWREWYRPFLAACDLVLLPSTSTARILERYFEFKNSVTTLHPEASDVERQPVGDFSRKKVYRIAVLGALSREKGADLLEGVATRAHREQLNVEFILIGYAYRHLGQVRSTGPYSADQLVRIIDQEQCDAILFPALWPETYSYTLSAALESGLPIVAPDIGAFPERLSGRTSSLLFRHPSSPEGLLADLRGLLEALEVGRVCRVPVVSFQTASRQFYLRDYAAQIADVRAMAARRTVLDTLEAVFSVRTRIERGTREKLLQVLWGVYTQPRLQLIFRLIPHRFKRALKRSISDKPLHDLIRDQGRQ